MTEQEVVCGRNNSFALASADTFRWVGEGAAAAVAHLYEHQQFVVQHDQIDLAAAAVEVPGDQHQPLFSEITSDRGF
jgi:hypothetical protein